MTISNELWFTGSGEFSVGFRTQTDLVTEAATGSDSDWIWLDVMFPTLSWEVNSLAEARSSGTRGAKGRTAHGKRKGTFAFRVEMPGQATTFDASSGNPVANGPWKFLIDPMGTAVGTFVADGVAAGGTTTSLVLASGTAKVGCGYAYGPTADAIRGIGFVKSVSGVTATLAYAAAAAPVASDNVYPLLTAFPDSIAATAYGFRVTGEETAHDLRLVGCVLNGISGSFGDADRLFLDFEFSVYAGYNLNTGGGVRPITVYGTLGAFYGADNAWLMVNQDAGACHVTDVAWKMTWPHHPVACEGAPQRVGGVVLRSPETTVSFTIDHQPALVEAGEFLFDSRMISQTPVDFALTTGSTSGQIFGLFIPAGLVQSATVVPGADGQLVHQVEISAGAVTTDGASTDAGNKTVRVVIG